MNFTQDWFSHNIPNFEVIKEAMPHCSSILEIGCFEGRATCWMLENMLSDTGDICCIDTFAGSQEHANIDFDEMSTTFTDNVSEVKKEYQTVEVFEGSSHTQLAQIIDRGYSFDFIYIDGDHTAAGVMTDSCMAFPLLRQGGVMLWDDYLWEDAPGIENRPKMAIDTFLAMYASQCNIVVIGYQLAVVKL